MYAARNKERVEPIRSSTSDIGADRIANYQYPLARYRVAAQFRSQGRGSLEDRLVGFPCVVHGPANFGVNLCKRARAFYPPPTQFSHHVWIGAKQQ